MLDLIHAQYADCINDIGRWERFMPEMAQALAAKGSLYHSCNTFLDGTFVGMCKPTGGYCPMMADGIQREFYSGHKKMRGLKYQAIMMPNGLIAG